LSVKPILDVGDVVARIMALFPQSKVAGIGTFVLDPGQEHPMHTDEQPPEWITRIHVPLVTNPLAVVETEKGSFHMEAGTAYSFDTRKQHAVRNGGDTPRVHLVFDVVKA
jgi:quercetin dioxygenase-like cupin family protein